jgi:hypothetical protein
MTPSHGSHRWLSRTVTAVAVALGLVASSRGDEEQPARPWLVPEANLPEGFPPPGPVDEIVVKTYPAHRLARVRAEGGGNGMFMKLFRHIERNDITMTAPVEMSWQGERPEMEHPPAAVGREPEAMAFLYGKPTIGAAGVDPKDPQVVVEDVPEVKVVSIGLRGGYDKATFDRGAKRLAAWLAEHPKWQAAGGLRSLAYNSPFVPNIAKYSEVQMPIVPASPRP